jgi:hypothetical protein
MPRWQIFRGVSSKVIGLAVLEPVEAFDSNPSFVAKILPSNNRSSIDRHHDLPQQFTLAMQAQVVYILRLRLLTRFLPEHEQCIQTYNQQLSALNLDAALLSAHRKADLTVLSEGKKR